MTALRSFALDIALVLAFAACTAHAQSLSWSHGVSASTALTLGVRLDPSSSRWLDARLRPLSPYRANKRADGAYLLPDTRLLSHTCDVQHLTWLGIGNWSGPRIVTQAFWLPVGYLGARLSNAPLSIAAMNGYTLTRSAIVPGYSFDPLGYSASIWSWGTAGAALAAKHRDWKLYAGLASLWLIAMPWATPWAGECP